MSGEGYSDEDQKKIRAMTIDGKSAAEIGAALSPRRSRNAIIGWWFRNDISVPQKSRPRGRSPKNYDVKPLPPRKRSRGGPAHYIRPRKEKAWKPKVEKAAPPPPPPDLLPPLMLELKDLPANGCTWPVNDGGPYLYCGNDRGTDKCYCSAHRSLLKRHGS